MILNLLSFLLNYSKIDKTVESLKILLAKNIMSQWKYNKKRNIQDYEFKVYSQFGDDGIIQYLINTFPSIPKKFIEFGVENYEEANTRFLLIYNNWSGMVIDGNKKNIDYIKQDEIYWKYDIHARCEFITKKNINEVIKSEGFEGEIGIMSIDIDGNDYWIWKEISVVNPGIVIIEYNSTFGFERKITIPYQEYFVRTKTHYSNLYWGTSLNAVHDLAKEKGYVFVGCNSAGNNAYFIRKDVAKGKIKLLSAKEGYVEAKFRESRGKEGKLTYLYGRQKYECIKGHPIYNTISNRIEKL
jgi:hypothetical protein